MKDYTVAVNELRDHYNALSVFKASVKAQVKAEYEAKMDFEIKSRIAEEELKFANHLAAVKEREQLPLTVIQDNVLRTRTWKRWEYYRDMVGMAPERVTIANAKAEKAKANSPFMWSDDYTTLTVKRAPDGTEIEPITYLSFISSWDGTKVYPEYESDFELKKAHMAQFRAHPKWMDFLMAEIDAQITAGNLADPRPTR